MNAFLIVISSAARRVSPSEGYSLGSLYAATLARDGHDVSLVARGERA